jgi:hypothetical protein
MKKIIILAGPPRCGKDTIAKIIEKEYGYKHMKFAQPIRDAAKAMFGITDDSFDIFKEKSWFSSGKNGRDWMIALSEIVTKPIMGKSFFGTRCAQLIYKEFNSFDGFVISDAGFEEELYAFILHVEFNLTDVQIEIWQIYNTESEKKLFDWIKSMKLNKNFIIKRLFLRYKGDSRERISMENNNFYSVKEKFIINDGSIAELELMINHNMDTL